MTGVRKGLSQAVLEDIARLYGREVADFGKVEGGYRNTSHSFTTTNDEHLNFILYKNEPHIVGLIKRTNELSLYLSKKLPVRTPVDERILRVGQRYGSLYSYLPGKTIAWEMYSMKHIKLLGFALARFHAAAQNYSGELTDVEKQYGEIFQRMTAYFGDEQVREAMWEKLRLDIDLPDVTSLLQRSAPRQALHMDFVRSNILFREAHGEDLAVGDVALAGILDLEKAAYGNVVFDIARTLAFLLVDCPKSPEKIYKYFLQSGYIKRGGGAYDQSLLESLLVMFLVYDLYKFLRQNPYESLAENHHFLRTAAILKQRKVLK